MKVHLTEWGKPNVKSISESLQSVLYASVLVNNLKSMLSMDLLACHTHSSLLLAAAELFLIGVLMFEGICTLTCFVSELAFSEEFI